MSLINRVLPELRHLFGEPLLRNVPAARRLLDDPFFREPLAGLPAMMKTFNQPALDLRGNYCYILLLFFNYVSYLLTTNSTRSLETDKNYIVEMEVPGLQKNNLDIEFLDDNTINVRGSIERVISTEVPTDAAQVESGATSAETQVAKSEGGGAMTTQHEGTYWSTERMRGSFQRTITLPGKVDVEQVRANLKDGILTMVVPKVERQGKKVEIQE